MGKLAGWLGTDLVEHALESDRSLLVGRGPSCSLSLAVATRAVSREHFRVVPLPGGRHQLVDLSSTNGTYVNGARVATALLEHGDVVRLGDVELLFLPVREDARAALGARARRAASSSHEDHAAPRAARGVRGEAPPPLRSAPAPDAPGYWRRRV
jgi:pSer/pThr/pTyr-binding forkhead associated (FHA) protein